MQCKFWTTRITRAFNGIGGFSKTESFMNPYSGKLSTIEPDTKKSTKSAVSIDRPATLVFQYSFDKFVTFSKFVNLLL